METASYEIEEKMEAVVFNSEGREREWIDPVLRYWETEDLHMVDNGYGIYSIPKVSGEKFLIRKKVA